MVHDSCCCETHYEWQSWIADGANLSNAAYAKAKGKS